MGASNKMVFANIPDKNALQSYYAYIDEAGDEGFNFTKGRTRKWFIVSAVITRKENDLDVLKSIVHTTRANFKMSSTQEIHFRRLPHEKKKVYLMTIASTPGIRAICVAIHKPALNSLAFQHNNVLYFYACRLLLERISWFCRDHYDKGKCVGQGYPLLVFSKRKNMSYDDIRGYFSKLHEKHGQNSIAWDYIDELLVEAYGAKEKMGLQVADAVASALYRKLNEDEYGNTEPAYFEMLTPILYKYNGKLEGYGLKYYPYIKA